MYTDFLTNTEKRRVNGGEPTFPQHESEEAKMLKVSAGSTWLSETCSSQRTTDYLLSFLDFLLRTRFGQKCLPVSSCWFCVIFPRWFGLLWSWFSPERVVCQSNPN